MNKTQAFPSKWLTKEDCEPPFVATVLSVSREELNDGDGGKETKTTIALSDHKPMICNGVNWDTIAEAYGDESDDWIGKMIECFHDPKVMFGNKKVGGVRVRIPHQAPTLDELRAHLKQARAELKSAGIEPAPMTQSQVVLMDAEQLADMIAQVEVQLPI